MTPKNHSLSRYTKSEEIANSIIHGVGIGLAIAGLVVLIVFANRYGNGWHVVSCSIFGAALIFLYTSSTLYHAIQRRAPSTSCGFLIIRPF